MTDKYIVDGQVAVIYSPGYGAGWYTWNSYPGILYDHRVVKWILEGKPRHEIDFLVSYLMETYPDIYAPLDNLNNLVVEWMPEGTLFWIDAYDGSEYIVYAEHQKWLTA